MPQPRTPDRSGQELYQLIDELNGHFNLDIPNPRLYSPSAGDGVGRGDGSQRWRIYRGLQRLYFDRNVDLYKILNSFNDWACVQHQRDDRLVYLLKLIDDETYLRESASSYSFSCLKTIEEPPLLLPPSPSPSVPPSKSLKPEISGEEDGFHTAPSSPVKLSAAPSSTLVDRRPEPEEDANAGGPVYASKVPRIAEEPPSVSRFLDKLRASTNDSTGRYDAVPSVQNPDHSFSTTMTTDPPSFFSNPRDQLNTSFNSTVTDITVPCVETETQYEDSVADHMLNQEHMMSFESSTVEIAEPRYSREGEIMEELLANGPFSLEQSFPSTVPLRYRYEMERVGRAWGVPLKQMLAGSRIPFNTRDQFWDWIKSHSQRRGKPLPEKPQAKAWDAAKGSFQTAKHSEVVVLSGEMTWCDKSEPGILKLNLRPLKTERTCRFHRRFGSDRFLSVVLPAPSRPPAYLKISSQPGLLRETLALWLTQKPHRCAGRIWKPFFVEQVKSKKKRASSEPRFRVDFFAIDGVDFNAGFSLPHTLPPVWQESEHRTPMTLKELVDWHMPPEANKHQTNCKLFQRLHLGLSKTFATVTLTPQQVLHLRDTPMNDGCALMSRALAQRICDSLGITGSTPSSFQGRIAGAKGLWMVDKHASHVAAAPDDIWIQISDSQLKIGLHPSEWRLPIDDEKLTFEVVKWSKPLHPVALNTQLLTILEHGGPVREYIGEITRAGIQALYRDFEDVFQTDCPLRCRALVQKLRPAAADASDTRRLGQWASNNDECIIRLTEAGFRPRSFYPLHTRLRKCLLEVLDRYVNHLHIQVPLSTYAFCIADPYGVLQPDEVHFGLSTQWTDPAGQFEDNLLDGIDVLVGRVPAHLPSDIQRRRAVWRPQLRHFKDVIVFPTTGSTALAQMLSGGDYDGDMPWICWDQNIVQPFANTPLPSHEYPASHYGLTDDSVPMEEISTVDEFLESAFTFNLKMSQLGRCTVEHETIAYETSIDSPQAIELACLLGHLVDARKAGVHLSEAAWQSYRKTINPSTRRLVPAYKNQSENYILTNITPNYKLTNIIDYLKFEVANKESRHLLTQLEKTLNDGGSPFDRDEDLTRPWQDAKAALKDSKNPHLQAELDRAEHEIDALCGQWSQSLRSKEDISSSDLAWQAAEEARDIPPPALQDSTSKQQQQQQHPLIHIWQHRVDIWLELLASLTYTKHPSSAFVIHAFGEELCRVKAAAVGAGRSRTVVLDVLGCYRVSQRAVARAVALDVADLMDEEGAEVGEEGEEEFDGVEAIQDWVLGGEGGYDPDDGVSVE
ncbi:putative RNA-directed RNA polymerase [Aspergillus taichungensis]|uniref:RNA-dependent RNA polymerase n=1 Tax=Aspergillus taichungensis TaxID=482145 RepID=A0A2J5HWI2_9EURO|nr:putative RNA-directed RNA polymerase [Aspergillus taichungensis]